MRMTLDFGAGHLVTLETDAAQGVADGLATAARKALGVGGSIKLALGGLETRFTPAQAERAAEQIKDGIAELRRAAGYSPRAEHATFVHDATGEVVGMEKRFTY